MKTSLMVGLLVLATAAPSRAAVSAGDADLTVVAGAALPFVTGNVGDGVTSLSRPGPMVGLQGVYQLTDRVGVGAELDYDAYREQSYAGSNGRIVSSHKIDAELIARRVFSPKSEFNPYVFVGAGIGQYSFAANSTAGNPSVSGDLLSPTASLGVGIETVVADRLVLGLEGRFHVNGIGANDPENIRNWTEETVALRIGYRFGKAAH